MISKYCIVLNNLTVLVIVNLLVVYITFDLAGSTSMLPMSLKEVRNEADMIIIGNIVDKTAKRTDHKNIVTEYKIEVQKVLKGSKDISTTKCSFAGGTIGSETVESSYMPSLEFGQRYIMFLHSDTTACTVGLWQGIYEVHSVKKGNTLEDIVLSYEKELIVKSSDGKIDRGRRVSVINNNLVPYSDEGSETKAGRTNDMVEVTHFVVVDAQGNVIPQKPIKPEKQLQDRVILHANSPASLDDFMKFILAAHGTEVGNE